MIPVLGFMKLKFEVGFLLSLIIICPFDRKQKCSWVYVVIFLFELWKAKQTQRIWDIF